MTIATEPASDPAVCRCSRPGVVHGTPCSLTSCGCACERRPAGCLYRCRHSDGHGVQRKAGWLCRRCWWRTHRMLAEMVGAHRWLGTQMLRYAGGQAEPVSGSHEHPCVLDVGRHDARELIADRLASWARLVVEEHGRDAQRRTLAGPADSEPETVRRWLVNCLNWIAARDWVDELIAELADTLKTAHGVDPWRRGRTDLPAPCPHPDCGLLTLTLYDGDDFVTCRNPDCQEIAIPWYRYDRWVRSLVDEHSEAA